MQRKLLNSGSVDYQLEIYVKENVHVTIWINDGMCMATLSERGHIYSAIQPFLVKKSMVIKDVILQCAMDLIANHAYDHVAIQVSEQLKEIE